MIKKDLKLIDNRLPNNFQVKIIEIANYFQNRVLTKSKNYKKIIPKKPLINCYQNL